MQEGSETLTLEGYFILCEVARYSVTRPWAFAYLTAMLEHLARNDNVGTLSYRYFKLNGDHFTTAYGGSKTKQSGEEKLITRSFYHNPYKPECTYTVAMSLHVCLGERQMDGSDDRKRVFGGVGTATKNFQEWLIDAKQRLTAEQLAIIGVPIEDLGCHGVRKGGLTHAKNSVDGPPAPASDIRSCHSQGKLDNMYVCPPDAQLSPHCRPSTKLSAHYCLPRCRRSPLPSRSNQLLCLAMCNTRRVVTSTAVVFLRGCP